MVVTVKSLELTSDEWAVVLCKLREEYGNSIISNSVMRKKVGFSRRWKSYNDGVYIEFWQEKYKTLFLLKYK